MKRLIEACVGSLREAHEAQAGGAVRVEVCAGIAEGGVTPSWGTVALITNECSALQVNVLIRPRGGDFCYDDGEVRTMIADIEAFRKLGIHGVVIGALTPTGDVDRAVMHRLMRAAEGLSVTFHRAFDLCRSPYEAFEQVIELGCDRLLTSGQKATAVQGTDLIAELVRRSNGRITVMAGCGIRASNIDQVAHETNAPEFHSTARAEILSRSRYHNPQVSMASPGDSEQSRHETRHEVVSQLVGE